MVAKLSAVERQVALAHAAIAAHSEKGLADALRKLGAMSLHDLEADKQVRELAGKIADLIETGELVLVEPGRLIWRN